jgi:phosphatidylglycerol:prolipoprotein diacylglycerol transferase
MRAEPNQEDILAMPFATVLALPFPMIDPVLIEFGPLVIRWYALAYIAGIFLGWWLARRVISRPLLWGEAKPPTVDQMDDFLVWAALAIVLGGRLGYVLFYNPAYYAGHPLEAFAIWRGGMSFHGAFAATLVVIAGFARRRGVSVFSLFDIIALVVPIGLFFGRLANFINAELYGRPSDVPWAFVFPGAGPQARHPSQIYEAGMEGVVLMIVLATLAFRFHGLARPGLIAGTFSAGYGIARIIAEFFRMPDAHIGFLYGGLTMGMVLSAPMIILGMALIWVALRAETAAPIGK